MIPPFAALEVAFKVSAPRDSVAILFLIEDSSAMSNLWSRLRDFYLPKVLEAVKNANPSVPIQVLWMPASQLSPIDFQNSSSSRRSRRWNDIPIFNFNQHSSSKVSPVAVSRAIDALASVFGRTQTIRHLVVIAVSNPTGDSPTRSNTLSWIPLVHRLYQEDTRLHMIVRSQLNMDGLTSLFWEMIKKDFSNPTVTDDAHYIFYLRNEAENMSQSALNTTSSQCSPSAATKPYDAMSNATSSSSATSSTSSINRPSLVFQLQKMNGMEKKRRSRVRRETVVTNKPTKPYQKSYGRNSLPASPIESSIRPLMTRSHTIDDLATGVRDTNSRGASSGDNSPYSSATSPTRSLSPPSPIHPYVSTLASSPRTEPHTAYDTFQRALIPRTPGSLSPTTSDYLELPSYKPETPTGPIRSHYPTTHAMNPRNSQSRVQVASTFVALSSWPHSQRDSTVPDFSYQQQQQLQQQSFLIGPSSSNGHLAEVVQDAPYLSQVGNYTEASADISSFYPAYDSGNNSFVSSDYATASTEPARYSYPAPSSSSLHPPPVSSFCDYRQDPGFFSR